MDLKTLLERLEAAEGPSRALDGRIAIWLGWGAHFDLRPDHPDFDEWPDLGGHWLEPENTAQDDPHTCNCFNDRDFTEPPAYTANLQAAVDLVERAIPDAGAWEVSFAYNGGPYAARICQVLPVGETFVRHKASPALALCTALVKTLLETEE